MLYENGSVRGFLLLDTAPVIPRWDWGTAMTSWSRWMTIFHMNDTSTTNNFDQCHQKSVWHHQHRHQKLKIDKHLCLEKIPYFTSTHRSADFILFSGKSQEERQRWSTSGPGVWTPDLIYLNVRAAKFPLHHVPSMMEGKSLRWKCQDNSDGVGLIPLNQGETEKACWL